MSGWEAAVIPFLTGLVFTILSAWALQAILDDGRPS